MRTGPGGQIAERHGRTKGRGANPLRFVYRHALDQRQCGLTTAECQQTDEDEAAEQFEVDHVGRSRYTSMPNRPEPTTTQSSTPGTARTITNDSTARARAAGD